MTDTTSWLSGRRIAIYGLGAATRDFLDQNGAGLDIAGLLDGYQEDGTCFGYPVLSLDIIPDLHVDTIVIIARPGSRRVIVHRIADYCRVHQIALTDPAGNDLLSDEAASGDITGRIPQPNREQLVELIEAHDVISFDIFDTLLMRYIPEPSDVHALTAHRLHGSISPSILASYPRERIRAEQMLSRSTVPAINDIYLEIQRRMRLTDADRDRLCEAEAETECLILCRRESVCSLFEEALQRKKNICLTSDMYLPSDILESFLRENGISGYSGLFVSCEHGCGKRNGLFRVVKQHYPDRSVLHIGDDEDTDIAPANQHGLTAFYIPAARALMQACPATRMLPADGRLSSKLQTGILCARLFDDPFRLTDGIPCISDPEALGFSLFAPIVTDFLYWLRTKAAEEHIDTMLFCARDGYLPQRLFHEFFSSGCPQQNRSDAIRGLYFLTSRMSAVYASLKTKDDINAVLEKPFSGSLRNLLRSRLLMEDTDVDRFFPEEAAHRLTHRKEALSGTGDCLLPDACVSEILENASHSRENYLRYIDSLQLTGPHTGMFDLVSTGSTQAAISKMTGNDLTGFYFMRLTDPSPEKASLSIRSYISPHRVTDRTHASVPVIERDDTIYEDYFLLESILSAPHPGVRSFADNGDAQYLSEDRTQDEIALMLRVQDGIAAYARLYAGLIGHNMCDAEGRVKDGSNRGTLPQAILHLIHHVRIDLPVFQNMRWSDPYYHRDVAIREML